MRSMCDAEVPTERGDREREIHREREKEKGIEGGRYSVGCAWLRLCQQS